MSDFTDSTVTSTTEQSGVTGGSSRKIGRPVPVVIAGEDNNFSLDEPALEKIFLAQEVRDKKVVVLSIAGAFRKGKSFLLNFLLDYLYQEENDLGKSWLSDSEKPLNGFPWRGGSERDTSGILIWDELFHRTLPNGEKVVVVLMDTQGSFDSDSTMKECATIFALSTMVSSVQVFNLSQNVQEDDLQHLQLFTEYGRLALEESSSKPFQALQFLVRDWSYPYEADFGADGGACLLEKRLRIKSTHAFELQQVREHIPACFEQVSCFLLPHPGLKVATSPVFDGRLRDIEPEFVNQLKILVPLLLSPSRLTIKKINGSKVSCRDLVEYFKAYLNIYKSDLPEPKTVLLATAEANNLTAVASSKDEFVAELENLVGGDAPYMSPDTLGHLGEKLKLKALEKFRLKKKMGGEAFSKNFEEHLIVEIDDIFDNYAKHNESKNIFSAARTPAVLFVVMMAFYLISAVFGFIGLYALSNICNMFLGCTFVTLLIWAYVRYSGELREVGGYIDNAVEIIWENGLSNIVTAAVRSGTNYTIQRSVSRTTSRTNSTSSIKKSN